MSGAVGVLGGGSSQGGDGTDFRRGPVLTKDHAVGTSVAKFEIVGFREAKYDGTARQEEAYQNDAGDDAADDAGDDGEYGSSAEGDKPTSIR